MKRKGINHARAIVKGVRVTLLMIKNGDHGYGSGTTARMIVTLVMPAHWLKDSEGSYQVWRGSRVSLAPIVTK